MRELLYRIDANTLHREEAPSLALNEIGRVAITTAQPLFFDAYQDNRANGGFVIIDPATNRTVGAGMMRTDSRTLVDVSAEVEHTSHTPRVSPNVVWDTGEVDREAREERNAHRAMVVWFTGLSGSGKSTIAKALEKQLFEEGKQVVRLDGDNVRHGLCGDLGFSEDDRRENIRRVAEAAKLFFETGHIVLCSFISRYEKDRAFARSLVPEGRFVEVYVKCDLEECRRRDPKGLYARADAGEIRGMTGVDAPYEEPETAEVVVDTTVDAPEQAGAAVVRAFGWG